MHGEAQHFTFFVKQILPTYFQGKIVLDIGSGDVNGNNKSLFSNCIYAGSDVCEGRNVDIIYRTKDLPFDSNTFDTIISTECFEHDPEYKQSILKIYDLLKPGGLFIFTCASTNRAEHGTRRSDPNCSFGTRSNIQDMQDYYLNLTKDHLTNILDLNKTFAYWNCYYNAPQTDMYFFGIKRSIANINTALPVYSAPGIINVS